MSRPQGPSSAKRKRPNSIMPADSLTEHERILYDAIKRTENAGIWLGNLKKETKLYGKVPEKPIKSLKAKNLIKEVVPIQGRGKPLLMAVEFEPSEEITGGLWYVNGALDNGLIEALKNACPRLIRRERVATVEGLVEALNRSQAFTITLSKAHVEEILKSLILDNLVSEVKSNGLGEFSSIPKGKSCYKCSMKKGADQGAMASIPCGVCPRISYCTPDGIISPKTCVYYKKWLEF